MLFLYLCGMYCVVDQGVAVETAQTGHSVV